MIVTTTETIPGYRIRTILGPVLGVIACTRNPFEEGVKRLPMDPPLDRDRALASKRGLAIAYLIEDGCRVGANAIIGMRFDHRDVSNSWTDLCAYGTAVLADEGHDR